MRSSHKEGDECKNGTTAEEGTEELNSEDVPSLCLYARMLIHKSIPGEDAPYAPFRAERPRHPSDQYYNPDLKDEITLNQTCIRVKFRDGLSQRS